MVAVFFCVLFILFLWNIRNLKRNASLVCIVAISLVEHYKLMLLHLPNKFVSDQIVSLFLGNVTIIDVLLCIMSPCWMGWCDVGSSFYISRVKLSFPDKPCSSLISHYAVSNNWGDGLLFTRLIWYDIFLHEQNACTIAYARNQAA